MKRHATEDVKDPERTLCGEPASTHTIDNADPDCARCMRVIKSRCSLHNRKRCTRCPRATRILGGN